MTKKELAETNFINGCNCAQAVLSAFSKEIGLSEEACRKLASSFGGGMGRMRLTCGAFTAMLMVVGLKKGYSDISDYEAKSSHYKLVQELAAEFIKSHGSLSCRELLGGNADSSSTPTPRTAEFYETRPCKKIIGETAESLEKILFS